MAYTAPTAADLKARFPAFAAVDDAVVNAALAARMKSSSTACSRSAARSSRRSSPSVHTGGFV